MASRQGPVRNSVLVVHLFLSVHGWSVNVLSIESVFLLGCPISCFSLVIMLVTRFVSCCLDYPNMFHLFCFPSCLCAYCPSPHYLVLRHLCECPGITWCFQLWDVGTFCLWFYAFHCLDIHLPPIACKPDLAQQSVFAAVAFGRSWHQEKYSKLPRITTVKGITKEQENKKNK